MPTSGDGNKSAVSESGRANFYQFPREKRWWKGASSFTMSLVATCGKLFWHRHKFSIENSEILYAALEQSKQENRGVLTLMNHISILDDPLVWSGFMPLSSFKADKMRWVMGARNICFINKPSTYFFSLGQVLPIDRFGPGPFQPAIDTAIWLMDQGKWLHMFPEGFVHQPYPPYEHTQKYFRWGVSRVVLEADVAPIIVPMYGTGLDDVFPEDKPKKTFGYGKNMKCRYRVGQTVSEEKINSFRAEWKHLVESGEDLKDGAEAQRLRSRVALFLRQQILEVRRQMGFQDQMEELGAAEFWRSNEVVKLKELKEKDPRKKKEKKKKKKTSDAINGKDDK